MSSIKLTKVFEEMIISRYEEMKESNISQDVIDKKLGLILSINIEPEIFMLKLKYNSDTLYIGSN